MGKAAVSILRPQRQHSRDAAAPRASRRYPGRKARNMWAGTFRAAMPKRTKADNRLRLYFDEKPSEEQRSKLKCNGFKWAPSVGAWQRQLNVQCHSRRRTDGLPAPGERRKSHGHSAQATG